MTRDNGVSHHVQVLPEKSLRLQQNEETEEVHSRRVITISSSDSSNESGRMYGDEVNSSYNMPIVNTTHSQSYADLMGNMAGEFSSHDHGTAANSDYTMSGASLFNNFQRSQLAKSSLNPEGNAASGVCSNSLGGRETGTSHIPAFTVDDDDSLNIAALLNEFHSPQVDPSIMNIGEDNLLARVPSNSQRDTSSVSSHAHSVNFNRADMLSSANQFNNFQRPQILGSFRSIGGNSATGARLNRQRGTGIGMSNVHSVMVNHNDDFRLAAQLNTFNGPYVDSSSMSTGNDTAAGRLATSQCITAAVHCVPSVSDNVNNVATQVSNFQSPHINGSSITMGGNIVAGVRVNSQGSVINRGSMITGANAATGVRANSQGSEVDRSSMSTGGNIDTGIQANSRNTAIGPTDPRSNILSLGGIYGSMTERNSLSIGSNMPHVRQSPIHERPMVNNNAMVNEGQAYNVPVTEQIDNNFLNLGLGGNLAAGFQSNVFGGGTSYNNGWPSTIAHRPQADGSFLSLGRSMGNQIWSDQRSRTICDTNTRANPDPVSASRTLPGDMQQYFQWPTGRSLGTGGNRDVRYAHIPSNSGFPGQFSVAPFNSVRAGVLASDQARLPMVAPMPSNVMGIPHGYFPTQTQQSYVNNPMSTPTRSLGIPPLTSSVTPTRPLGVPPLTGSVERTSGRDNSGKRGPAGGGQSIQSAKLLRGASAGRGKVDGRQSAQVLRGPSASYGIPAPVAGRGEVPQNYRALAQLIKGRNILPTMANISQPSGDLSTAANGTKVAHHLKWNGFSDSIVSVGENCQLCKRDLTYAPTGPFTQPPVPPEVAVLPCGHTFHDECLERITPSEQSKDPPCIPCAIGTS